MAIENNSDEDFKLISREDIRSYYINIINENYNNVLIKITHNDQRYVLCDINSINYKNIMKTNIDNIFIHMFKISENKILKIEMGYNNKCQYFRLNIYVNVIDNMEYGLSSICLNFNNYVTDFNVFSYIDINILHKIHELFGENIEFNITDIEYTTNIHVYEYIKKISINILNEDFKFIEQKYNFKFYD